MPVGATGAAGGVLTVGDPSVGALVISTPASGAFGQHSHNHLDILLLTLTDLHAVRDNGTSLVRTACLSRAVTETVGEVLVGTKAREVFGGTAQLGSLSVHHVVDAEVLSNNQSASTTQ